MGRILTVLFLVLLLFGCNSASKVEDIQIENSSTTKENSQMGEEIVVIDNEEPRLSGVISIEDLGVTEIVIEKDSDNLEFKNDEIEIEIDKYKLSSLKVKDEYRHLFKDTFENTDKISLLGIWMNFKNLTKKDIEIPYIQGTIETNTGEIQNVIVQFMEYGHENFLLKANDNLEDGTIMASFSTAPELIKEVTIKLEGFVEIKFEL